MLAVLTGGARRSSSVRVTPPIDLEPGDIVLFVADAPLALRYEPWEDEESGGFRAWLRADFAEAARVREAFTAFCSDVRRSRYRSFTISPSRFRRRSTT